MKTIVENGAVYVNGVHQDNLLAFGPTAVALLIGVSYWTVRREILRRKLRTNSAGLIAREELLRYLREEEKPKARSRRRSRDAHVHESDRADLPAQLGCQLSVPRAATHLN